MTPRAFAAGQLGPLLVCSMLPGLGAIADSSATAYAFAHQPATLSGEVFARHAIEHVFRIRMFRAIDSAATKWLTEHAPEAQPEWASYARSEADHDRYFLRDLKGMGIERDQVEAYSPFPSTIALGAYVKAAMESFGALPVVLYSYWTEHNSEIGSAPVIACAANTFGSAAARGASSHRALDEQQDHAEVVVRVLLHLIQDDRNLALAAGLLDGISHWIKQYFLELDQWRQTSQQSDPVGAGSLLR